MTTRWEETPRVLPPEVTEAIEAAWEAAKKRPGVNLFDGNMVRLNSWRVAGQQLELTLSHTSYRQFLGTNLANPGFVDRFGVEVMANPLGLSAALQSSDGFLLLGRRNEKVAYYPNRVHPFAGSAVDGDVFAEMRRELNEELGMRDEDIAEIRCIGLAEDLSINQPELIFGVVARRTRREIEDAVDRTEHVGVVAASDARGDWTPIAEATVDLWERTRTRPASGAAKR